MKEMITTGVSSFEKIIKNNFLYVDKTEYIYNLVIERFDNYYFISRPRRFGKSLMCSTLEALFKGKRELFKGLYIDSTDYDFKPYPVLYFNFANLTVNRINSFEAFNSDFQDLILNNAIANGINDLELAAPSTMMRRLLMALNKDVVILIDEYDAPIIHALDLDFVEDIRGSFNSFYAVIKNTTCPIRFLFITGVTKFSNLSLFSAMNNLDDISLYPEYADMFGYNEEEVEHYFSEYIDEYLKRDNKEYDSRDEFIATIRNYYDGYLFSPYSSVRVYNPVSLGKFFTNKCVFENYWGQTGPGSTLAVELAKEYGLESIIGTYEPVVGKTSLTSFDLFSLKGHNLSREQVLALLFFSGYLTIKKGGPYSFVLAFPNAEVRTTFTNDLSMRYCNINLETYLEDAINALAADDINSVVKTLNKYYKQHPYSFLGSEKSFQQAFYSFFLMFRDVEVRAEEETLLGRCDVVLSFKNDVYIIEMKVDKSADDAVRQIKEKRYFDKYEGDKKVHLIGLSFSSKEKLIEDWKEEIL